MGAADYTLLGGRIALRAPDGGPGRPAVDPVLLAAAVAARAGESVLDVGCGAGAVALCLASRVSRLSIAGIDIDPGLVEAAGENARRNGLDGLSFAAADVAQGFAAAGLAPAAQVVTNPPFAELGQGNPPPGAARRRAHVGENISLDAWVGFCLDALKPKGRLTLILRADRLDALVAALAGRAGEITIFPVWTKPGRAAKRVLVSARKGVRSPAALAPGLVLQDEAGAYTPAAEAILRDAAPLDILAARR